VTSAAHPVLVRLVPFAILLGSTAGAHAQAGPPAAAFLPSPSGDLTDPEPRLRAMAAVREGLEADGMRVLPTDAVRRRLPAPLRSCAKTDCADGVARAVGAQVVAAVAVWASPPSVAVSLVTPKGHAFAGTAPIEGDGVEAATRTALATARRRQHLGPGPWVHVHGEPTGALVLLDGSPVGVLPHRAAITPGRHTLQVRLDGHEPHERTLDVGLSHTDEIDVEVHLTPRSAAPTATTADTAPDTAPPPPRRRTPLNILGPTVLGTAAAGLLAGAGAALARRGCALEDSSGQCLQGRRLRALPFALYLGTGIAAAVGAVLWFTLTSPDSPASTEVGVAPFGLHLRRQF
jgi:hypothetical protein